MLPSLLLQLFPFKVNETVVIVNKNEQKLADEIEAALEKLSKDGTLKKISEKWYHRDLFDHSDRWGRLFRDLFFYYHSL